MGAILVVAEKTTSLLLISNPLAIKFVFQPEDDDKPISIISPLLLLQQSQSINMHFYVSIYIQRTTVARDST